MPAPIHDPVREIAEQWEYEILTLTGDPVAGLNAAGKRGWELIQLEQQEGGPITALCKRRPSRIQVATAMPSRLSL